MQVVYEACCGIDVHKRTVVASAIVPGPDGQPVKETRTFDTLTENLEALAGWLQGLGVTHVAMESTGVYWKPVYNLLDGRFAILVVNAEHIKALAGRKTDVQDAERIADLLRHGLLKGSFIPSAEPRLAAGFSPGIGPNSAMSVSVRLTGCRRCWRTPTSSWRAWRPM